MDAMASFSPPGGELWLPQEAGWPSILQQCSSISMRKLPVILSVTTTKVFYVYCFHGQAKLQVASQDWGRWPILMELQDLTEGPFSCHPTPWHIFQQQTYLFFSISFFLSLPRLHCLWNFPQSFQNQDTRLKLLVLMSDIRLWLLPWCCIT